MDLGRIAKLGIISADKCYYEPEKGERLSGILKEILILRFGTVYEINGFWQGKEERSFGVFPFGQNDETILIALAKVFKQNSIIVGSKLLDCTSYKIIDAPYESASKLEIITFEAGKPKPENYSSIESENTSFAFVFPEEEKKEEVGK